MRCEFCQGYHEDTGSMECMEMARIGLRRSVTRRVLSELFDED